MLQRILLLVWLVLVSALCLQERGERKRLERDLQNQNAVIGSLVMHQQSAPPPQRDTKLDEEIKKLLERASAAK